MKIMVLSDGETYSEMEGCKVYWVRNDIDPEKIESLLKNIKNKGRSKVDGPMLKEIIEF